MLAGAGPVAHPTFPGPAERCVIARNGALHNSSSAGALNPVHSLESDDFPVYLIQLPAKLSN